MFAGHSVAGSELSELGSKYKARVDKLIYLDAADLPQRFLPSRREPPSAIYTDADLTSLLAFQAAKARLQALRTPDPSVCLGLRFNANGVILESTTPAWVPERITQAISGPPTNWPEFSG